ncbi:MAG: hypothetical protein JNM66_03560 [Bryobacterales bacterium]|nr:hypothetical protein [Bryobacterales bacterium]
MPNRQCLVLIPVNGGHVDYTVDSASSMDAARQAIALHRTALADDCVLTVVLNGRSPLLHGWREHNDMQPTFRHRVGAIRGKALRSQAS